MPLHDSQGCSAQQVALQHEMTLLQAHAGAQHQKALLLVAHKALQVQRLPGHGPGEQNWWDSLTQQRGCQAQAQGVRGALLAVAVLEHGMSDACQQLTARLTETQDPHCLAAHAKHADHRSAGVEQIIQALGSWSDEVW